MEGFSRFLLVQTANARKEESEEAGKGSFDQKSKRRRETWRKCILGGDVGNERKLGRNLSLGGGLYPNMGSRRIAKIALKDKLSPLGSFFSHLPATELTVFSPLSVFLARHR